jgi:hypothetical protein
MKPLFEPSRIRKACDSKNCVLVARNCSEALRASSPHFQIVSVWKGGAVLGLYTRLLGEEPGLVRLSRSG